jgi:hypothetical protein
MDRLKFMMSVACATANEEKGEIRGTKVRARAGKTGAARNRYTIKPVSI